MSSEAMFANLKINPNHSIRLLTIADAEAAAELVRKVDIAACGESTTTVAELAGDIESSQRTGGNSYGIFAAEQLVICLMIQNELVDGRGCFIDVFADPDKDVAIMRAEITTLINACEQYVQEFLTENQLKPDYLKTALYEQDAAFITALKDSDFEQHRTYWRLRIDHSDLATESPMIDSLQILDFVESKMTMSEMHELSTVIFNDHYDFSPMNFDDWKIERVSGVNSETLWRVAYFDGKAVGYCWRSRRFEEEGFSYVASLGVIREFRGRGIAKALLIDAFEQARAAGLEGTLLHCDSANPNGATELYVGAGMKVDRIYPAFRKLIS